MVGDVIANHGSRAKTRFGRWMQNVVVPTWSNEIQGGVYFGAALLIVIIGLRAISPEYIPNSYIVLALLIEAIMLVAMSLLYIFTPEDFGGSAPATEKQILSEEKHILAVLDQMDKKMESLVSARIEQVVEREVQKEFQRIISSLVHQHLHQTEKTRTS
jgi:hypothetical protein